MGSLMVNNVCGWFPYRVMQRSGVVERVLGKKPTNAKDRVCVARPDLAPAGQPPLVCQPRVARFGVG